MPTSYPRAANLAFVQQQHPFLQHHLPSIIYPVSIYLTLSRDFQHGAISDRRTVCSKPLKRRLHEHVGRHFLLPTSIGFIHGVFPQKNRHTAREGCRTCFSSEEIPHFACTFSGAVRLLLNSLAISAREMNHAFSGKECGLRERQNMHV